MNSLQKLVAVWPKKDDFSALSLVIELGMKGVSCYWHGKNTIHAEGLVMYRSDRESEVDKVVEDLRELLSEKIFQEKYSSVKVFIRPEETLLIPADYYSTSGAAASLDLVFGDLSGRIIRTEDIQSTGIKICYRLPGILQDFLAERFSSSGYRHSGACLLPRKKEVKGHVLECLFSPGDFMVNVYFSGKLFMMQHFEYRSSTDVAYFLLAICHHHKIKAESVTLKLSGTIDKDSNLFSELFKYFIQVEWAGEGTDDILNNEMKAIPAHYFDHLVALASCGS